MCLCVCRKEQARIGKAEMDRDASNKEAEQNRNSMVKKYPLSQICIASLCLSVYLCLSVVVLHKHSPDQVRECDHRGGG